MAHDYDINTVSVQMTVAPTTVTTVVDSTIPEWAKQPEKPTYNAHEVGAYNKAEVDAKVESVDRQVVNLRSDLEGIREQANTLESDVEGIQEQIKTEAHFKGYLSTNAKIQALEATPNDFAYSAESGTKWIYDVVDGWQDTGSPVPDQLTPASDTTPLINGEASVGTEEAYARGDHRHPTDTTRASVAELNDLKDAKADKPIIEVLGDIEHHFEFGTTRNAEIRLAEATSISFTFGNGEYAPDYTSGLSFDSGATPTAIDYTDSGILNWVGTDCTTSNGLSIFQPSANTHYDIVFYFNGTQFIGLVNGFIPSTGNEAV